MLVIATQSMATRDGGVAADDAIECTDEQGEKLIAEGLARLPDEDGGEPTPKQKRNAFRWPSDELPKVPDVDLVPKVDNQTTGDQPKDSVVEPPAINKPLRTSKVKRGRDATANPESAP